jgi:hypothetical protein
MWATPNSPVGYPGGTQMLVVREAVGSGKHKREFELPGERTPRCIPALAGSNVAAANSQPSLVS